MRHGSTLTVCAALLAALATACGPGAPAARDLVIVVLDALPADGLGCHGYPRPVSPRIDGFAAEGVRFDDAHAPATYTLASTASLFTGLRPAAHGVLGAHSNVLHGRHRTLAEALEVAEFSTAAFSCNPNVSSEAGFDQGFTHFELRWRDRFDVHAVPGGLVEDVLAWWEAEAERRRFLYVHLLPPHQPYDAPPPHGTLFGAASTPREEGLTEFLTERRAEGPVDPDGALARRIRARYDAGVHYADAAFGALLDGLDARGAREGAAVVLLSDHGEAFGEHGDILHAGLPFREQTHVPLIVRSPGLEPGVRGGVVGTRDLAATACALLDVPWPRGEEGGTSFLERLRDGGAGTGNATLSRSAGGRPVWSLRTERWTLLRGEADDRTLLYDRDLDPGESVDVAARRTEARSQLQSALASRLAADRSLLDTEGLRGGSVDVWADALRDLGYAGWDEDEED